MYIYHIFYNNVVVPLIIYTIVYIINGSTYRKMVEKQHNAWKL